MSNTRRRRDARSSNRSILALGIAAAAVVVVLLVIVIVAAVGGGNDKKKDAPAGVEQTRPVTVRGTPLPTYDSAAVQQGGATDTAVGTEAPTIAGSGFDGAARSLAPTGTPQAIAFVAHWCPHCQREVPKLAAWVAQHGRPDGVDITIVATGTRSDQPNYPPSTWLADAGPRGVPVLADDDRYDALEAMGGPSFPYWVFLDGRGRLAGRWAGEFPDGAYDRIFAALADGRPVDRTVVLGTNG
jgi:cytochrome c biogenesis protein CcmG/thiol:disulfide interchange protein DsbE